MFVYKAKIDNKNSTIGTIKPIILSDCVSKELTTYTPPNKAINPKTDDPPACIWAIFILFLINL